MKGFTERDLAIMATHIEAQGISLYERCLALFPNLRADTLLRALEEERQHLRTFERLSAQLERDGEQAHTDAEHEAFITSLVADIVFPAGIMEMAAHSAHESLPDLLTRMMNAEALSITYYEKAGEANPRVAAIAADIAREEKDHRVWLEGLLAETLERQALLEQAHQRYAQWLALCQGPDEQAQLNALAADEDALFDAFWRELEFATAGMRGVIGLGSNRMNAYNVRKATQGLAQLLLEQPGAAQRGVVIAYDSRRFSPEFAKEAALTLCASGVTAHLFPSLRPVPVLSFSVRHLNAAAGIVITASHNPKEYNGYKVYGPDGGQMTPEATERLTQLIERAPLVSRTPADEAAARAQGLLFDVPSDVDDAYIARVRALCVSPALCREMGAQLPILYTPLNGSGNLPVRRILAEIGFTRVSIVEQQTLPDPEFTTVGTPNPENPAAFALALDQARSEGVALVFGTDPDCDRLGVAARDDAGSFILLSGNQIGCLLAHYILSALRGAGTLPANGAIVKSIVSTQMAAAIAGHFGVAMFDVLTGFKFIAEKIQAFEETGSHTFLFGFEESYGFLAGTFVRDKDAVIASMLLAEAAAWYHQRGMTLWQGLEALYKQYGYYGERGVSVTLAGKEGQDRIAQLMAELRRDPPEAFGACGVLAVRDLLSGTRTPHGGEAEALDFPASDVLYYEMDGGFWVCVRPSGTEPKIKLYLNAVTGSRAHTDAALDALEAGVRARMGV